MRGSNEPLLSSPSPRNTSASASPSLGKPLSLLITLLSATLLCAAVAFILLISTGAPDLCAGSPDPASCNAIVAGAVAASSPRSARYYYSSRRPAHQVLRAILARSLAQHDAAAAAVSAMHRRAGSSSSDADANPRRRAALADCVQLMDLARDRLADAFAATDANADDARAWISAALTFYATCADGVGAFTGEEPPLDAVALLKSLASASLAVLNAVTGAVAGGDVFAEAAVDVFPSWVPARDRALLERGAGAAGVKADAVVAQDGSGGYRTVKEAVDAAPDGGGRRYVIYVKKGVYRENVEVGKKKRELMIVGDGMDATVITGSRNVVDGATTFNSATLDTGSRRRDHPAGPTGGEHGGSLEAAGGGASRERRPRRRLPVPRRRVPGHAVRARAPAVLPRVLRLGHRRLRLRQRGRRAPGVRAGGARAVAWPAERRDGAGKGGSQPEHGHEPAPVPRRAGAGPGAGGREGGQDVPGPTVEGLLADGVREVLPGRARGPQRVARVGRGLRARHALLRGVRERGARCRHGGARRLARVPRHHRPERGGAVHRRAVHTGWQLAQRHRL